MQWNKLNSEDQVNQILEESKLTPVLIFKHSNRCSISRVALDRLERKWNAEELGNLKLYFLDLLSYREISHKIASQFGVRHESPQVLVIENGQSVYNQSHWGIDYERILEVSKRPR
ncbi:MAG: bacillithiol system redox-active protein YtxJ [Cyclobacteriaceae bacterium]|jgi:bacillithiol system protein YtxJ|nr:bacillithiol system redox-active protein YtxJ [Cyclobacteriaceae bacterium]MDH4294690.1 bacillithiol system redox-active protein YtxJ [Cyclobacteriaceae bacterium]MDH5248953.1 bacillithiol system redox-active protein YtxJ [Cyclobacteriaceae bacterium]